ncbi:MAG TPA: hypothetical protein VK602_02085 [Phyllobacterium sp.]|nr:hypothetical protein [Phyllobacterium sp.]
MAKAPTAKTSSGTKLVFVTRGNYAGQFLQLDDSQAAAAKSDQWGLSTEDGASASGFDTSIPDGWDISTHNLPKSLTDFETSISAAPAAPASPAPEPKPAPAPRVSPKEDE